MDSTGQTRLPEVDGLYSPPSTVLGFCEGIPDPGGNPIGPVSVQADSICLAKPFIFGLAS